MAPAHCAVERTAKSLYSRDEMEARCVSFIYSVRMAVMLEPASAECELAASTKAQAALRSSSCSLSTPRVRALHGRDEQLKDIP